jgi:hypothetical protein
MTLATPGPQVVGYDEVIDKDLNPYPIEKRIVRLIPFWFFLIFRGD